MTRLDQIREIVSGWIEIAAESIVAIWSRLFSHSIVRLVEDADGSFQLRQVGRAGSASPTNERLSISDGLILNAAGHRYENLRGIRTEFILRSNRFMFRPLELPKRAGEFLDGIVRSQIDRLTPWSAGEAVFGWSNPTDISNDRIVITVAATARATVTPLIETAVANGAEDVSISTVPEHDSSVGLIKVFEQSASAKLEVRRVRRGLIVFLVIVAISAAVANVASSVIGSNLSAQQDDLSRRIAARRAAMRLGDQPAGDVAGAVRILERRKREIPSSTIVLEALSQILPDHTYVTELRIEGDKIQVVGITRDAPSLIRLLEQSKYFVHATFFAPTTRTASDPGERFHIEARIEPLYEIPG